MSITYVIHDVAFEEEGPDPAEALDPATKAAIKMQGVGEIGAILLVPCAGAPLLVTTGYGQSRPDLAYPLFWVKRSLYVRGGDNVVRVEWEPVEGAAYAGSLPIGYDMEIDENSLYCLDVELCQVLMMLTLECGKRRLNRAIPETISSWYQGALQNQAPELMAPLFDLRGRARHDVWTRRASETLRGARHAATGGI